MKSEQEGVHWATREQRWIAKIYRAGKLYYLGSYITEAEAIEVRKKAEHIADTMQPRETVAERQAQREREKVLKQIDEEYEKRFK